MRLVSAVVAALALALLSPLVVLAQSAPPPPAVSVPRLINVSGVFQPADGQPPGPVEVVTLSIYAQPEGDLPLWQEMQTVTPDKTGRFTVLLGATHPEGLPPEVFASGEARWMGMLFARPGEVERPRVRITSVPYALKASDAETLGGRPASAYLLAPTAGDESSSKGEAGKGGAGKSDDAAEAKAEAPATADLVLPGTVNLLAKYVNGADVGPSVGVFENAGGAVGLGTTTPFDRFHVRFTNTNGAFTGLAVQNLGNSGAPFSGMLFYDQFGAVAQFQGFNNLTHEYRINNVATNASINFMTASTSRFIVAPNGNIGIGTTTPSALLEVSNAVPGGPANMWMTSYTNALGPYYMARRARGTFAAPSAVLSGDDLAGFFGHGYGTAFGSGLGSGMYVQAAENWTNLAQGTRIQFRTTNFGTTGPAPRMTLAPTGYLGLGTNFPDAVVDVVRQDDTADVRATGYATGDVGNARFLARTARGTIAAPTAVQLGDELGGFAATGRGPTGFGDFSAGMGTFAGENWTDTAQGAGLYFATTPLGTSEAQAYLALLPSGNVGLGVFNEIPTITDKLQVFGDIRVGTAGTNGCLKNFNGDPLAGSCVSDRRYKKGITPFGAALGPLTALQPVHYFWRSTEFPAQNFGDGRSYGLIAQDVEHVLPDLVMTGPDGFKAVDYSKLPLLTIQAVKELKAENDALKQRVAENEALKHRVAELERVVAEILATSARR